MRPEESRRLLAEFVAGVEYVPPFPEDAPLPEDPDDVEARWPGGIEEIPNEFETPERLRYDDGTELT